MRSSVNRRTRHGLARAVPAMACAWALAGAAAVQAAPGSEAACKALAARAGKAVGLKQQGVPLEKALPALSARNAEDGIPDGEQAAYFDRQLPGAVRFAYVAGMNAETATAYYLKQCRTGR